MTNCDLPKETNQELGWVARKQTPMLAQPGDQFKLSHSKNTNNSLTATPVEFEGCSSSTFHEPLCAVCTSTNHPTSDATPSTNSPTSSFQLSQGLPRDPNGRTLIPNPSIWRCALLKLINWQAMQWTSGAWQTVNLNSQIEFLNRQFEFSN